jgi:RNA polymerase sigma-70 factor (ECF subfamily)
VTSAADAVARAHRSDWARIVAGLIRVTGDWALAEDATGDAFATALVRWEADGTPPNPAAWLALTARNRAIDLVRRAANERSNSRRPRWWTSQPHQPAMTGCA